MMKKQLSVEEEKDIKQKRTKETCTLCKKPFYRYWISPIRSRTCFSCHDKFPDVFKEEEYY